MSKSDAEIIGLLAGGDPSEHRISLRSATTLREAILRAGYNVLPVLIARDGTWNLLRVQTHEDPIPPFPEVVNGRERDAEACGRPPEIAGLMRRMGVSIVALALHGKGGEDGAIQGFLERCGLGYTGSGVTASAVALDKLLCKRVMLGSSLPTPPFLEVKRCDPWKDPEFQRALLERLGETVVVKARGLGSSVEVHIASGRDALVAGLASVLRVDATALVETFVKGREATCAVLGHAEKARALPVIEIVPRLASWFDASSKYTPAGADEICPGRFDSQLSQHIQDLALALHRTIGAEGVTRTDILIPERGEPTILEINTLPGMTSESLVPKAARAAGLEVHALVSELIEEARARHRHAALQATAAAES